MIFMQLWMGPKSLENIELYQNVLNKKGHGSHVPVVCKYAYLCKIVQHNLFKVILATVVCDGTYFTTNRHFRSRGRFKLHKGTVLQS